MVMEILVPNSGDSQPDPRRQDPPDLFGHADRHRTSAACRRSTSPWPTPISAKLITLETALARSSNPDELQDMINRGVSGPASRDAGAGAPLDRGVLGRHQLDAASTKRQEEDRMPVYVYRGTDRTGNAVSGERTAANKAELMNLLKRQQIKVNKMSEKGKEFNLPTFGGQGQVQGHRHLYAPVLGDDRCRPAAGAVPGDSGRPAGEQDLPERPDRDARTRWKAARRCPTPWASIRRSSMPCTSTWWKPAKRAVFSTPFCSAWPCTSKRTSSCKRPCKSALIYPVAVIVVAVGVITLLLWKVVSDFCHPVRRPGRRPARCPRASSSA